MGLLQKAVETYDMLEEKYAGVIKENEQPLAPSFHAVKDANIEITLDKHGDYIRAKKVENKNKNKYINEKRIIPVTEGALGRSGKKVAPYPLCDQLKYLCNNPTSKNEENFNAYVNQLEEWANSEFNHPMLKPILQYVKSNEILKDLRRYEVNLKTNKEVPELKEFVFWRVKGIGSESGECWTNKNLFSKFQQWSESKLKQKSSLDDADKVPKNENNLCMVTGAENTALSNNHPKGIVSKFGNAKLISANDKTNYTFRGRFKEPWQAATVGYAASQKAHNALAWLVANQGVSFGGRTYSCWNPRGKKELPKFDLPFLSSYNNNETGAATPTNYKKRLNDTLNAWKITLPETEGVVIAAFDAASDGRLSLCYYNELQGSDFAKRLHDWDATCCWYSASKNKNTEQYYIYSPSLQTIILYAYGTPQKNKEGKVKIKVPEKLGSKQMQRLIACRVDKKPFPTDIKNALVIRASKPLSYKNWEDKYSHSKLISTTCAVIRKFYYDHKKEEMPMELNKEVNDRSYHFGRLLAVYNAAESATYKQGEDRQTNAIRFWSQYCKRPLSTARKIEEKLQNSYFCRLEVGFKYYYQNMIDEIFESIARACGENTQVLDKPLADTYLLGFHLQKKEIYTKKPSSNENENENVKEN